MKDFFKKIVNKSFIIELDEALIYPSVQSICVAIEKYATESKEQLKFESKIKPITFYLDNTLYRVEIRMARGGYYISCIEI
ncbi:DUF4318 domain-containing protein [Lysinibacillus sp. NPDC058147]|uniref:DUF4318 domain-containing protein n=1 Tax=unclassified Lysinibacillus TaxID=2636778 RepID=UPI0036DDF72C